jgi:hypothetical protein
MARLVGSSSGRANHSPRRLAGAAAITVVLALAVCIYVAACTSGGTGGLITAAPATQPAGSKVGSEAGVSGAAFHGMFWPIHRSQGCVSEAKAVLREIADLGADTVLISNAGYQDDAKSATVVINPAVTPSREQWLEIFSIAHENGLRVILMPIVLLSNPRGNEWREAIAPPNWDDWFAQYQGFLLHFTRIAAEGKVEMFMVGSELVSTERFTDRWRRLIAEVRRVFPGKLSYSANWDHYKVVKFWDDLDLVGMSSYYKLSSQANPSLDGLVEAWRPIKQGLIEWQETVKKPLLFTEVGWCSQEGASIEPWDYYYKPTATAAGMEEQRRCYAAFMKTWENVPQVGGAIWRGWGESAGGNADFNYTPRGKPAEQELRRWFKRQRQANARGDERSSNAATRPASRDPGPADQSVKVSMGQLDAPQEGGSRAWYLLRQSDCGPLLRELPLQLARTSDAAVQSSPMWRGHEGGVPLEIDVRMEADAPGELVIGLFADERWSQAPIRVQKVSGAGRHTIVGVPPGKYQIGAMIGDVLDPKALGVHRSWPQPAEVAAGRTAIVELLVSPQFERSLGQSYRQIAEACQPGRKVEYPDRLVQGRVTDASGGPVVHALLQIREHTFGPRPRSIWAIDTGTDALGHYFLDKKAGPLTVSVLVEEPLPGLFGSRSQFAGAPGVHYRKEEVDFALKPFPRGSATLSGRGVDQDGRPVQGFVISVRQDVEIDEEEQPRRTFTYRVPCWTSDGRFVLTDLPSGKHRIMGLPFDHETYQFDFADSVDVELKEGETTDVEVLMKRRTVLYGRVLMEDGTVPPAAVNPPWPEALMISCATDDSGMSWSVGHVDSDGYVTVHLTKDDREALESNKGTLSIEYPVGGNKEKGSWKRVGVFAFDELSADRAKAGAVKIRYADLPENRFQAGAAGGLSDGALAGKPPVAPEALVVRVSPLEHAAADHAAQTVRDVLGEEAGERRVVADKVTNSLVVSGAEKDLSRIAYLVAQLDKPEPGQRATTPDKMERVAKVVRLKHAKAAVVAETVGRLYPGRASIPDDESPEAILRDVVTVTAAKDPEDAVVVSCDPYMDAEITALIAQLDTASPVNAFIRVFRPRHVEAGDLDGALRKMTKDAGVGCRITLDDRTSSVIVQADSAGIRKVARLVEQFDRPGSGSMKARERAPNSRPVTQPSDWPDRTTDWMRLEPRVLPKTRHPKPTSGRGGVP